MNPKVENRPVFQSGQRVRCIDDATFNKIAEGAIYTVSEYDDGAIYLHGIKDNHSAERFQAID